MITSAYVQTMARYNIWQNSSLYSSAEKLTDLDRRKDRGAIFHSIHQTLSHLLWGDQMWMNRFAGMPKSSVGDVTGSLSMIECWETLKEEREVMDKAIIEWSKDVKQEFLESDMSWYSGSQNRVFSSNAGRLVVHMFNHQTHHRGQVHAMLTGAGVFPDDTDLFIME
ncbi:MAG: DinB family protein [Rhizobiaceae bacterium]